MNRIFCLICLFSTLFLFSCKKDDPQPLVFSFDLNGVSYDLSKSMEWYQASDGTWVIKGSFNDTLRIFLYIPTLSITTWTKSIDHYDAGIEFIHKGFEYHTDWGDNSDYTIRVSSFSNSTYDPYIKGTFSGWLGTSDTYYGFESEYIQITNGKFYIE